MAGSIPTLGLAFFAGLASFLSPCVFALVPAYVSYLGGRSVGASGKASGSTWRTFSHGLAFVTGFSLIFIGLGLLSSGLGALLFDVSWWLSRVGGAVVILFGLHLAGILRIPFLDYDLRAQSKSMGGGTYLSSVMMGIFFSAGWAPCVGPVLGAILTLALNEGSLAQGGLLLGMYSLGLAIPFLLAATQITWVTFLLRRYKKLSLYVERIMGIVLILVGMLLISGRFSTLASLGFFFDIFDELRVGQLLLAGLLLAAALGVLVGFWAKRKEKPFVEWWFLGSGVSFLLIVVLYFLGVFSFISV
jgi:cytochrome c-type biogenesis protein